MEAAAAGEICGAVLEPIAVARPNAAHQAITELERFVPVTVVTQNVDGLHQQAGSTIVHEVHGSLLETATLRGRFERLIDRREMQRMVAGLAKAGAVGSPMRDWRWRCGRCWVCRCAVSIARPWCCSAKDFRNRRGLRRRRTVKTCDVLISIGTSGMVFPAALLPMMASDHGATVITIDPSADDDDLALRGPAGEWMPKLLDAAFGEHAA